MALAGLMLKLGAVCLLRFLPLIQPHLSSFKSITVVYFIIAATLAGLLTAFQSDFKKLVAYSSVLHISILLLCILHYTPLASKVTLLLIIFHGFTSPLIFYLVGVTYKLQATRSIILLRSFLLTSPLLAFLTTLTLVWNVPFPPLPQFLSELQYFISVYSLTSIMAFFTFTVTFLTLLYSILWFLPIIAAPSRRAFRTNTNYRDCMLMVYGLSTCALLLIFLYIV